MAMGRTVCSLLMELTYVSLREAGIGTPTNLRSLVSVMKLQSQSNLEIFVGLVGLTSQDSGMMLRSSAALL